MIKFVSVILIITMVYACGSNKKVDKVAKQKEAVEIDFATGPPTLIYKTKDDYNNLVPVILSDDKSAITSYPHPKDLFYKGKLALPSQLADGYLLDNRGISQNVAFLNITYGEYSKFKNIPSPDSLYTLILDKEPLLELYNCGNRHQYKNEVEQLNGIINDGQLVNCKKIIGKN